MEDTRHTVDPQDIANILSLINHYREGTSYATLSDFETWLSSIHYSYSWEDK